jgi:hypothetical protein
MMAIGTFGCIPATIGALEEGPPGLWVLPALLAVVLIVVGWNIEKRNDPPPS